jgi:spore maturation protein CgeB
MKAGYRIAFFGSSLVSAFWNGAATYYRGLIRALHQRGARVTFFEPDAYERQAHRDIPDPDWASVRIYRPEQDAVFKAIEEARNADLIVKASGIGVFDTLLEAAVLDAKMPGALAAFWDVDAPATLDRIESNPQDPFLQMIPRYDVVFTYGGGKPVVDAYLRAGAKRCVPIYNALDESTHGPVAPDRRFESDLAFLGNRLPDREARVGQFFFTAAERLPARQFLLGGNGWESRPMPRNVRYVGHVYTADHNAFNCSPRAVLNVNRESMARYGFSPATRIFEAAGAGACIITDAWEGIDFFLEPQKEILVARDGEQVADILDGLNPEDARRIGNAARRRILAAHTYGHRALEVERTLDLFDRRNHLEAAPA